MRIKKPIIKTLSVEKLTISDSYNREVSEAHANNIKNNFDINAIGLLTVAERLYKGSSEYVIIDGQHRFRAYKKLFPKGKLHCLIEHFHSKNQTEYNENIRKEAQLFLKLNNNKPVTGNSKFKASFAAGIPIYTDINNAVENIGFKLLFNNRGRQSEYTIEANGIITPSVLITAYQKTSIHALNKTLDLYIKLFGGADKVPYFLRNGNVIYGFCLYFHKHSATSVTYATARLIGKDIQNMWQTVKNNGFTKYNDFARALYYAI